MIKLYYSMALNSIKRNKTRSFLTTLGVVIGVTSVVMIFSLGEGLRRQVAGELGGQNSDLIVVRSGNLLNRSPDGSVTGVNLSDVLAAPTLKDEDVEVIKAIEGVASVAPSAVLSGEVSAKESGKTLGADGSVLATTPQIRDISGIDVETGQFFTTPELERNLAVLGPDAASALFGEDPPVGRIIVIRSTEFIVRGVMKRNPTSPLDIINTNYNNTVYIPLGAGRKLASGQLAIREIGIKLASAESAPGIVGQIDTKLTQMHQGANDYSVLTQDDYAELLDRVFGVLTSFVAAVAFISLVVGGIGIMNIMLVSVSERTREIGVRKSIGANNQQILGQFLIEAVVLTCIGGIIGVGLSALLTVGVRVYTDLDPYIELRVIGFAVLVTVAVGVVFGIVPAFKAARKDPIESLR
jgi:putative ABC transport system permease protein